ncbi:MAG: condensation domain-containing protein [bacterium]|nr:condensation domain-containing protein [bacterium]
MKSELEELKGQVKKLRSRAEESVVIPRTEKVFEGMFVEEYQEMSLLYGTNIQNVSACRFQAKNRMNYVQSTVKIMYALDHEAMKRQYQELVESSVCLRTAYYNTKKNRCYKVQLKSQTGSIRFYDLSGSSQEKAEDTVRENIFADRRRGFQLEREPLVRVLLFKINQNLYYALISQVCEDDGSEKASLIIKKLFGQYLVYKEGKEAYNVDRAWSVAEKRYWKDYLQDLGKRQFVPGHIESDEVYHKGVCRMISDDTLYDTLNEMAVRKKIGINDVMEAAWAILLHRYAQDEDILFGASGDREGGGIVPIRTMVGDYMKSLRVVMSVSGRNRGIEEHKELTISQLEKGLALNEPLINHLLSFNNMALVETTKPSKEKKNTGEISVVTYTEERWDFCLNIRVLSGKVAFNCIYDQSHYEPESVQAVLEAYMSLLRQITEDEQKQVGELRTEEFSRIEDIQEEREKQYLRRVIMLAENPVFSSLPAEELEKLALSAQIMQCTEYDVVLTEGEEVEMATFIIEGSVKISKTGKDGWERPILLLKKNQMLTGQWIQEDRHSGFTMTANSMNTTLMHIPIPVMIDLMSRYPGVARACFGMANDRYMRVVKLWMNAD